LNTFNSFCIAACLFMIFIGMSMGFIGLTGAFPTGVSTGFHEGDTLGQVSNLTGNVTGSAGHMDFWSIWGIATGIGASGVFVAAILTKSTNMIAIGLFGTFFWGSWGSLIGILYMFDFLTSGAGLMLVTMITVGMTFIFVGAIIGMLSGSIWMR